MDDKQKVWVVTMVSESQDHYGPWVFKSKPKKKKIKELIDSTGETEECMPDINIDKTFLEE